MVYPYVYLVFVGEDLIGVAAQLTKAKTIAERHCMDFVGYELSWEEVKPGFVWGSTDWDYSVELRVVE